jgi:hypothetical protein
MFQIPYFSIRKLCSCHTTAQIPATSISGARHVGFRWMDIYKYFDSNLKGKRDPWTIYETFYKKSQIWSFIIKITVSFTLGYMSNMLYILSHKCEYISDDPKLFYKHSLLTLSLLLNQIDQNGRFLQALPWFSLRFNFKEHYKVICMCVYTYIRTWFEVFTALTIKNAVFWNVVLCGFNLNWHFGITCYLLLQGRRNNTSEEKC